MKQLLRASRIILVAAALVLSTANIARAGDIPIGPAPTDPPTQQCTDPATQQCSASTSSEPTPPTDAENDSQASGGNAALDLPAFWQNLLLSII